MQLVCCRTASNVRKKLQETVVEKWMLQFLVYIWKKAENGFCVHVGCESALLMLLRVGSMVPISADSDIWFQFVLYVYIFIPFSFNLFYLSKLAFSRYLDVFLKIHKKMNYHVSPFSCHVLDLENFQLKSLPFLTTDTTA